MYQDVTHMFYDWNIWIQAKYNAQVCMNMISCIFRDTQKCSSNACICSVWGCGKGYAHICIKVFACMCLCVCVCECDECMHL